MILATNFNMFGETYNAMIEDFAGVVFRDYLPQTRLNPASAPLGEIFLASVKTGKEYKEKVFGDPQVQGIMKTVEGAGGQCSISEDTFAVEISGLEEMHRLYFLAVLNATLERVSEFYAERFLSLENPEKMISSDYDPEQMKELIAEHRRMCKDSECPRFLWVLDQVETDLDDRQRIVEAETAELWNIN